MREARHVFGSFVFDARGGVLLRNGEAVIVGSRAIALLKTLIEARGEVVAKTRLMECVWLDAVVEDSNLTVQISALRKLLGSAPDGRDWIATVPRIGYRFCRQDPAPPPNALKPTLAVLPFANIGGDAAQDYFADGVVEDLITALSRFRSFAVIARNATFPYRDRAVDLRQVAAELGVRYVLEGSIRRVGDRLRIAARLVDGTTLAHLWAHTFDGTLGDVFDFQDRITETVATIVEPHIQSAEIERQRRERPGGIAVYDIYLRALARISTEIEKDNAEACALLRQGLDLEPDNPLLLSHAAWALEHRHTMGWPPIGNDDRERCIEFARRGLENAAGDAMVMAHCGMALLQTAKDYDAATAVLMAAAEMNPNNLLVVARAGVACLHCGSIDDAFAYFRRANRLSPGDTGAHFAYCGIAHAHLIRGDHQQAHDAAMLAWARNQFFDPTLWILVAANAHLGRFGDATRFLRELKQLSPSVTIARIRAGQPSRDPGRMAALLDGLRLAGLAED